MEYRGVEYEVVQTITNTWRWSVKRDDLDKTGTATNRNIAIIRAQRFIDELIKVRAKAEQ
jgi:hypothetical protein